MVPMKIQAQWYFKDASTTIGMAASSAPTYPTDPNLQEPMAARDGIEPSSLVDGGPAPKAGGYASVSYRAIITSCTVF